MLAFPRDVSTLHCRPLPVHTLPSPQPPQLLSHPSPRDPHPRFCQSPILCPSSTKAFCKAHTLCVFHTAYKWPDLNQIHQPLKPHVLPVAPVSLPPVSLPVGVTMPAAPRLVPPRAQMSSRLWKGLEDSRAARCVHIGCRLSRLSRRLLWAVFTSTEPLRAALKPWSWLRRV